MTGDQDSCMDRARGHVYGFFSALLLNQPTAELLGQVIAEDCIQAWDSMFPQHPACARLRELARAYKRAEWQEEDFILDYEALFRVPGESYVHPFETVYRQEGFRVGKVRGSAVLGDPAREVAAVYRDQGLSPREGFTELPDHLGVELELLAVLCRKTAEVREQGDQRRAAGLVSQQRAFLSDHLLNWGPLCLNKIRERAKTPLYSCMADLLQAFLEQEGDWIAGRAESGVCSSAFHGVPRGPCRTS